MAVPKTHFSPARCLTLPVSRPVFLLDEKRQRRRVLPLLGAERLAVPRLRHTYGWAGPGPFLCWFLCWPMSESGQVPGVPFLAA